MAGVVVAALVSVLGSVALKSPCLRGTWVGGFEYSHLCYNDIQPLYYARHLDSKRVPYVEEFVEYPTLTGSVMYLTALGSRSDPSFFAWNALVLGLCALVAAAALAGAAGARTALMFAVAPSLVLYATHNWDLLAVASLAVGIWLWRRDRPGGAGLAFGLGTAAKLFPAAALVTGVAALLRDGRRRDAAVFGGSLLGVVTAWNVPFAAANAGLWWRTWSFHAGRFPDYGSAWYWLWDAGGMPDQSNFRTLVDWLGPLTLLLVAGAVVWLQFRRGLPMTAATGTLVAAFLVVSKVHSPQYALWVLPFFVVVPGSWLWFAAYEAVDLATFVSGFLWIAAPLFPARSGWAAAFETAVLLRAVVLVLTAVHFARGAPRPRSGQRTGGAPSSDPVPSVAC